MIEIGKASLLECQTVYSIGDIYLLLEVIAVNSYNRHRAEEHYKAMSE